MTVVRAYTRQRVYDQIPHDELRALYVEQKQSAEAIGVRFGVGATLIRRMLHRIGITKNPRRYVPIESRFVKEATGCWVWTSFKDRKGYAVVWDQDVAINRKAHRVMYERHKGLIPQGMQVDHLCRVRACVNPDHLELVTNAENQQRGARAKLTVADVVEMRRLYADGGTSQAALADKYGIHEETVRHILHRRTWANIP